MIYFIDLCRIIQDLSYFSSSIIFIAKGDQFLLCTYNPSSSLFSKTTLQRKFFTLIDTTFLPDEDSQCCISSESANLVFKIPRETLDDINYLRIDIDSSKDFIDIMFFGPSQVIEAIKIDQITFINPIDNYLSCHDRGEFFIVSSLDIWENLFKRQHHAFSQVILSLKNEVIVIKLREQNTGKISNFCMEINTNNFIQYNKEKESTISFSYGEFAKACKIISKLSRVFALEYVSGEAPLKMTGYQSELVDFEIFFPCNIE